MSHPVITLLPMEQNPFRHYNRTQIRQAIKALAQLRKDVNKFGPNLITQGICQRLTRRARRSRGYQHQPKIDWTHWPLYSGSPTYPVPAPPELCAAWLFSHEKETIKNFNEVTEFSKAFKEAVAAGADPETFSIESKLHQHRTYRRGHVGAEHHLAYTNIKGQHRWTDANPYGAARLNLLHWLLVHARVMHRVLNINNGRRK